MQPYSLGFHQDAFWKFLRTRLLTNDLKCAVKMFNLAVTRYDLRNVHQCACETSVETVNSLALRSKGQCLLVEN